MDTTLKKFHMEVDCAAYLHTTGNCGDDCACCLNEVAQHLEGCGAKHIEARVDRGGIQCTFYLPLDNAENLRYIKGVQDFFPIDG